MWRFTTTFGFFVVGGVTVVGVVGVGSVTVGVVGVGTGVVTTGGTGVVPVSVPPSSGGVGQTPSVSPCARWAGTACSSTVIVMVFVGPAW